MRYFYIDGQTLSTHREAMIVGSDFNPTFLQIFYRLISAAMPKEGLKVLPPNARPSN